jgi:uncharacterized surface protein with fasciclin (FAS1) repeats
MFSKINSTTFKNYNMKIFISIKKSVLLLATSVLFFTACNKLELEPVAIKQPAQGTTPTLATLLDDPSFSLLKAAVVKADLLTTLANTSLRFTVFAPDDAAITASLTPILPPGVTPAFYIANVLTPEAAKGLISYHVIPQTITASSISTAFPNFQYPSILNPKPEASALLRLTTFPSVRPGLGAWVNNVPIIATDVQAVNGVLHKVFRLVSPPSEDLWQKIEADSELTYLEAAINRADSGAVKKDSLRYALSLVTNELSIASNLTVFAPNDVAMKAFLVGAITQALLAQGVPLATAQGTASFAVTTFGIAIISDPYNLLPPPYNAQLASALTPTVVKGLLVYHILGSQSAPYTAPGVRVFSVNLPSTSTAVKTFLNSVYPTHPGITVQATFASPVPGLSVVTAASVKGAANATASNVVAKDIHCVNGVMHKIDQVLLPQ